MSTHDTVTVTFTRAEYEAVMRELRTAKDRRTDAWGREKGPCLFVHDSSSALLKLEAAGAAPLSIA